MLKWKMRAEPSKKFRVKGFEGSVPCQFSISAFKKAVNLRV
jgi:hypothetical protein